MHQARMRRDRLMRAQQLYEMHDDDDDKGGFVARALRSVGEVPLLAALFLFGGGYAFLRSLRKTDKHYTMTILETCCEGNVSTAVTIEASLGPVGQRVEFTTESVPFLRYTFEHGGDTITATSNTRLFVKENQEYGVRNVQSRNFEIVVDGKSTRIDFKDRQACSTNPNLENEEEAVAKLKLLSRSLAEKMDKDDWGLQVTPNAWSEHFEVLYGDQKGLYVPILVDGRSGRRGDAKTTMEIILKAFSNSEPHGVTFRSYTDPKSDEGSALQKLIFDDDSVVLEVNLETLANPNLMAVIINTDGHFITALNDFKNERFVIYDAQKSGLTYSNGQAFLETYGTSPEMFFYMNETDKTNMTLETGTLDVPSSFKPHNGDNMCYINAAMVALFAHRNTWFRQQLKVEYNDQGCNPSTKITVLKTEVPKNQLNVVIMPTDAEATTVLTITDRHPQRWPSEWKLTKFSSVP